MGLSDEEGKVLPGLAAVIGEDPGSPLPYRPCGVRVEGFDAKELRPFGLLQVGLNLPRVAPVLRAEDEPPLPDGPAALLVRHGDAVKGLERPAVPLFPGR